MERTSFSVDVGSCSNKHSCSEKQKQFWGAFFKNLACRLLAEKWVWSEYWVLAFRGGLGKQDCCEEEW